MFMHGHQTMTQKSFSFPIQLHKQLVQIMFDFRILKNYMDEIKQYQKKHFSGFMNL